MSARALWARNVEVMPGRRVRSLTAREMEALAKGAKLREAKAKQPPPPKATREEKSAIAHFTKRFDGIETDVDVDYRKRKVRVEADFDVLLEAPPLDDG